MYHLDTDHFFIGPNSTLTTLTPGIGQHLSSVVTGNGHKSHTRIVKLTHNVQGQIAIERNFIQGKYIFNFCAKMCSGNVAYFYYISASGSAPGPFAHGFFLG
jgi:hypothetical protein